MDNPDEDLRTKLARERQDRIAEERNRRNNVQLDTLRRDPQPPRHQPSYTVTRTASSVPQVATPRPSAATSPHAAQPDASATTTLCPFAVYLTSISPSISCGINAGVVVKNIATGETASVTGLGSTAIGLSASKKIWLKATLYLGLTLDSIEMESGNSWPEKMVAFTGTSPNEYQEFLRVKIGEVKSGAAPKGTPGFAMLISGQKYHFVQHLNTNLLLALSAVDGKAAFIFIPFPG